MNGTVLLFGFDSLLSILALEAAVGPLGAEVVPVAKQITIRHWQCWRGWTQHPGRCSLTRGGPWAEEWWCCADWMDSWMRCWQR